MESTIDDANFAITFTVDKNPEQVFAAINNVHGWWAENIEGSNENPGDTFKIRFDFGDSFEMKITDIVPNEQVSWLVTDSNLTWIKDAKEWVGTRIIFDINAENGSTRINFTHVGLVPEVECYNGCVKGWNYYINESLYKLITEGAGQPDKIK